MLKSPFYFTDSDDLVTTPDGVVQLSTEVTLVHQNQNDDCMLRAVMGLKSFWTVCQPLKLINII